MLSQARPFLEVPDRHLQPMVGVAPRETYEKHFLLSAGAPEDVQFQFETETHSFTHSVTSSFFTNLDLLQRFPNSFSLLHLPVFLSLFLFFSFPIQLLDSIV